jgi:hypothetical protein
VAVTAADPHGDPLAYSATRPTFGRVVGDGSGNFVYTPRPFARVAARVLPSISSDRFSVSVTDSHGTAASVPVTTRVVPVNAAPKARATTVRPPAASSGTVTGRAKATDPNRDNLTYLAGTTATGKGRVTVNGDGTFSYTPTASARHAAASVTATAAAEMDTFDAR